MPVDKWGFPFLYPTKKTAGVTGSGSGFFWQQRNDIRTDEDAGMVRFGKEADSVDIISTTTGEFMFPFTESYSFSDYIDMEGSTGHHSGGETHGCEGFEYRIKCSWNVNPAKFAFTKQMYHGGSHVTDPATSTWTHSSVNYKVIGSGWNGWAWVRYNKKDGRSTGHDSVILECWWNPDPDTTPLNWIMLKRTEDKGNWGTGGDTCDGVSDQVGTWSNIQFRFKSGGSDFSLHPLKPEFEDGSNIHSIGGADMSFEDSEKRGYGYRSDMPVDIEMKCLFKMDIADGRCHFKNLSIREIDPTLSFDDVPTGGTGGDPGPVTTSEVIGSLTIKRDINSLRTSACSAAAASYGTVFYSSPEDGSLNDWAFPHGDTSINKTRIGILCNSSSSTIANKPAIKRAEFYLKKTGSPTGTATCKIRGQATDKATIGTLDVSTLTTSAVLTAFTNTSNTYVMVPADRIIVEFTGGDASNYVSMRVNESLNVTNGNYTKATYFNSIDSTWNDSTTHEVAGNLYG